MIIEIIDFLDISFKRIKLSVEQCSLSHISASSKSKFFSMYETLVYPSFNMHR